MMTDVAAKRKKKRAGSEAPTATPASQQPSGVDESDALSTSIQSHRDELADLAKSDPSFYSYLLKNSRDLLNFGADDDEVIIGGDDGEEEEEAGEGGGETYEDDGAEDEGESDVDVDDLEDGDVVESGDVDGRDVDESELRSHLASMMSSLGGLPRGSGAGNDEQDSENKEGEEDIDEGEDNGKRSDNDDVEMHGEANVDVENAAEKIDPNLLVLTEARYDKLCTAAIEKRSTRGFKAWLAAFRTAVWQRGQIAEAGDQTGRNESGEGTVPQKSKTQRKAEIYSRQGMRKSQKKRSKGDEKVKLSVFKPTEAASTLKWRDKVPVKLPSCHFRIEDETLRNRVIETTIKNVFTLLEYHCTADESEGSQTRNKGKKKQPAPVSPTDGSSIDDLRAPQRLKYWKKYRACNHGLWIDILYLLQISQHHPAMLQHVFTTISSPSVMRWLLIEKAAPRVIKLASYEWGFTSSAGVRLSAFATLLNFGRLGKVMRFHKGMPEGRAKINKFKKGKDTTDTSDATDTKDSAAKLKLQYKCIANTQAVIGSMIRRFQVVAKKYNWRTINRLRFQMSCLVEMMKLDASMAYRIAYSSVREYGLTVRSLCALQSRQPKGAQQAPVKTSTKLLEIESNIYTWTFLLTSKLWVLTMKEIPGLRGLGFPLSVIVSSALKTRLGTLRYSPFSLHCLELLTDLSESVARFVPVLGYAAPVLTTLVEHESKVARRGYTSPAARSGGHDGGDEGDVGQVANKYSKQMCDVQVMLRVQDSQLPNSQLSSDLVSTCLSVITDNLGLLSRHPSFPEVANPIAIFLKRAAKGTRVSE
eukprot:GHVN01035013.1.p1 GENE.GHVN01035013.1~~GHVN01035013.1.p1  ORF type:complete len:814 (+),score=190.04 GHVN01035013.1:1782-4223(+)